MGPVGNFSLVAVSASNSLQYFDTVSMVTGRASWLTDPQIFSSGKVVEKD